MGGVRGVSKSSSGIKFLAILTPALALSVTTSVGSEKTNFHDKTLHHSLHFSVICVLFLSGKHHGTPLSYWMTTTRSMQAGLSSCNNLYKMYLKLLYCSLGGIVHGKISGFGDDEDICQHFWLTDWLGDCLGVCVCVSHVSFTTCCGLFVSHACTYHFTHNIIPSSLISWWWHWEWHDPGGTPGTVQHTHTHTHFPQALTH